MLDFGASHRLAAGQAPNDGKATAAFATPGYASCEVLVGERPDAGDDVFALACVAYLLLCGRHPFPQHTAIEARALGFRIRRPPNLSSRQWSALRAGLRWERENRPADVQEWLEQLNLRGAAKSLVELTELMEAPAAKRSNLALNLAAGMALIALLGGGFLVVRQRAKLPSVGAVAPAQSADGARGPADAAAGAAAGGPRVQQGAAAARLLQPPGAQAPGASAARFSAVSNDTSSPPPAWVKVEMLTDTVEIPGGDSSAHVVVRRRGNLRGETGFVWWTESGTAKPGLDFAPMVPRVTHFEEGKSSVALDIPLGNTLRAQPKSFYVVIDMPEDGAKLGTRTLTMVTLMPTSAQ